jgi:thiamine phosphate synthase YjbQ (UPF0047 family)
MIDEPHPIKMKTKKSTETLINCHHGTAALRHTTTNADVSDNYDRTTSSLTVDKHSYSHHCTTKVHCTAPQHLTTTAARLSFSIAQ